MAEPRIKALVAYEDGKQDMERVANAIAERLDPARFEVAVRPASLATISELLAAKLYFFGAESAEAAAYGEIARVLKGINLAGRKAAFFGASGSAVAWLRGLFVDTDVSAAHADLVGRRSDHAALGGWLRGLA